METTKAIRLYTLGYAEWKTYVAALLFVAGNIALPQLLHLVPGGGVTWLPIYFFTLIGAYKYGWKVGLLTALVSPFVNHLLFGMPPAGVLPIIWIKSGLLALAAGLAAQRFQRVSLLILAGVVLAYQVVGTPVEWAITGSWRAALQDFRIALPGMLFQIFGGYLFIRYLLRKA
jgi:hypothetical protein